MPVPPASAPLLLPPSPHDVMSPGVHFALGPSAEHAFEYIEALALGLFMPAQ